MQEAEATATVPMSAEELLAKMALITDRAIQGVSQAMQAYQSDIGSFEVDPRYKALEKAQPMIVRAILEAEILRFAQEAQAT